MAQARMLHKKISLSSQVNSLSLKAQLLFTWLIPHADDRGRLKGEAVYIKATVVPMKKWSSNVIEDLINEIVDAKLIYRWQDAQGSYIQLIKWDIYQKIRKDRFIPSLLPQYEKADLVTKTHPNDNQVSTQFNPIEFNNNKIESDELNTAIDYAWKMCGKGQKFMLPYYTSLRIKRINSKDIYTLVEKARSDGAADVHKKFIELVKELCEPPFEVV